MFTLFVHLKFSTFNGFLFPICYQTKSIVEKTEENLGNMIHLMLNTQDKSTTPVPINKDDISMTVLKAKGKDMPSDYSTAYGSLTLPYWETFQGEQKGKDVLLSVSCF